VAKRSTDGRKRDPWAWLQKFRVWTANRKAFLYPENYLEPEPRDDKAGTVEKIQPPPP